MHSIIVLVDTTVVHMPGLSLQLQMDCIAKGNWTTGIKWNHQSHTELFIFWIHSGAHTGCCHTDTYKLYPMVIQRQVKKVFIIIYLLHSKKTPSQIPKGGNSNFLKKLNRKSCIRETRTVSTCADNSTVSKTIQTFGSDLDHLPAFKAGTERRNAPWVQSRTPPCC